jgi:hypothetical protein
VGVRCLFFSGFSRQFPALYLLVSLRGRLILSFCFCSLWQAGARRYLVFSCPPISFSFFLPALPGISFVPAKNARSLPSRVSSWVGRKYSCTTRGYQPLLAEKWIFLSRPGKRLRRYNPYWLDSWFVLLGGAKDPSCHHMEVHGI